ncbi:class I SAM-dependent methyltransferase [Ferruginibacter sp.]|nr:class I SAM-dependent methyltransferase [Ferruginibacter sp.]
MNLKQHWENVFTTKQVNEVSWYQPTPQESIDFIQQLGLSKKASIIDIGGGDSFLVDHLLNMGYTNITLLDISQAAIDKVKNRLGEKANRVTWIVSNILDFKTNIQYDCWHDRAAFHFLTTAEEVASYLAIAQKNVKPAGKMIIGTFSDNGPEKCSGLPVKQYDETLLSNTLQKWFEKIKCITTNHITPFKTVQNFLFCSFQKLST